VVKVALVYPVAVEDTAVVVGVAAVVVAETADGVGVFRPTEHVVVPATVMVEVVKDTCEGTVSEVR